MATQLQFRSGTTAENDLFTGAVGEPTYDTDTGALRIHDGTTMGGKIIDTLVDFQLPTAQNNYTWYRKYASGWVEQGGTTTLPDTTNGVTETLPVTMSDTHYSVTATAVINNNSWPIVWVFRTSATQVFVDMFDPSGYRTIGTATWEVKGMAA